VFSTRFTRRRDTRRIRPRHRGRGVIQASTCSEPEFNVRGTCQHLLIHNFCASYLNAQHDFVMRYFHQDFAATAVLRSIHTPPFALSLPKREAVNTFQGRHARPAPTKRGEWIDPKFVRALAQALELQKLAALTH
jgi:hypothetical protein